MQHHGKPESINIIIVYVMSWPKEGFVGPVGQGVTILARPDNRSVCWTRALATAKARRCMQLAASIFITEKFRSRIW